MSQKGHLREGYRLLARIVLHFLYFHLILFTSTLYLGQLSQIANEVEPVLRFGHTGTIVELDICPTSSMIKMPFTWHSIKISSS
ncbi:hypothetical protein [Candidatus Protochlamydia sp. W-9]|uniref:hypothetical protein n=1 Tax=Candidatus Protochlamydia sp. W-9 TaxID=1785087 RepID=UPI001D040A8C|nr:hypothetical protein [Candidatus Protochlamydia sp. W-9]